MGGGWWAVIGGWGWVGGWVGVWVGFWVGRGWVRCLQVLGVDRALGVAQHLLEHRQVDRVADGDGAVRGLGLERREVLLVTVRVRV